VIASKSVLIVSALVACALFHKTEKSKTENAFTCMGLHTLVSFLGAYNKRSVFICGLCKRSVFICGLCKRSVCICGVLLWLCSVFICGV
jgi:hypothetical protein